jgi:hypothetical protein
MSDSNAGRLAAAASMNDSGNPSDREGSATASKYGKKSLALCRKPKKIHLSDTPKDSARYRNFPSAGPSPIKTNAQSMFLASALMICSSPFRSVTCAQAPKRKYFSRNLLIEYLSPSAMADGA